LKGRTPNTLWGPRAPLSAEERAVFLRAVESNRRAERALRGHAADEPLEHAVRAAVDRVAVRDALCAHDYLTITARKSRTVSPPDAYASLPAGPAAGTLAAPAAAAEFRRHAEKVQPDMELPWRSHIAPAAPPREPLPPRNPDACPGIVLAIG
jgi:hypothetical protein